LFCPIPEITLIRPYKKEDKNQLLDILKKNAPTYFDPNEIEDFEAYLIQNQSTYLTLEHDSKIVGGAGYFVNSNDRSGRVTWIFFHPDYTQLGLGTNVMNHCLKLLKSDARVEKLVVTTSQLAFRFFEKFGYELQQVEKDHWGPGLDLYLMERQL